jgi:hypothetical protein
MAALTKNQIARIQSLYVEMPGAPFVRFEDGVRMWGEVNDNDHWRFCEMIVRMMDEAAGSAVAALCSEHSII